MRRRWKAALVLAGFALVAVALVRPAWNPKPKQLERRGRDVVFVLDVSRSMLAEDLAPNRLERAKLAIVDCVERLRGDRVALVAFAGSAALKCPLTLDYGFFRTMLEDIGVDSIARGGTKIGDALRSVVQDVFDDQQKEFKDIILITDGEDHDSFPVRAAEKAGERGIRLIAIGIGDEDQGKRIPVTDERGSRSFLKDKSGQEVWTRLDADTLRKMVNATPGGKYFNVATGTIDLGAVYTQIVDTAEKKALESKTVKRYEEKFQIFLGLAFLVLCAELAVSERKRKV
jgi:Ca-activated chloride channel family protein